MVRLCKGSVHVVVIVIMSYCTWMLKSFLFSMVIYFDDVSR